LQERRETGLAFGVGQSHQHANAQSARAAGSPVVAEDSAKKSAISSTIMQ
jgi:hypothetical protein